MINICIINALMPSIRYHIPVDDDKFGPIPAGESVIHDTHEKCPPYYTPATRLNMTSAELDGICTRLDGLTLEMVIRRLEGIDD